MLVVKAVDSFFIPKVATIIEGVVFGTAAMKAEVGGTDDSDRDARLDVAKGRRVGAAPLFAEELGDALQSVLGFGGKHAINRDNERNKITANLVTLGFVFFVLRSLGGNQTFHGICVDVGGSIEILNFDVKDCVSAAGKEAADQEVAPLGSGLTGGRKLCSQGSWRGGSRGWGRWGGVEHGQKGGVRKVQSVEVGIEGVGGKKGSGISVGVSVRCGCRRGRPGGGQRGVEVNQRFVSDPRGRESSRAEGASSSRTSLWRWMTRPPVLHWTACSFEKGAPHPSQVVGRPGGSWP